MSGFGNVAGGRGGNGRLAVVLLGHGSRAQGAAGTLAGVAGRLAESLGCPVEPASLQFNQPTLEDSCRGLLAAGYDHLVIAPYFLFEGNHLKFDIPEEVERIAALLPGARLTMSRPLGADERLVEVMHARVRDAVGGVPPGREPAGPAGSGRPMSAGGHLGAAAGPSGNGQLAAQAQPEEPPRIATHPIESQSFDIIDDILQPEDPHSPEYQIVRRVVHATGDPEIAALMSLSEGAVDAALAALGAASAAGASTDTCSCARPRIVCDVRMVASGIEPTARRLGIQVSCAVDGEATARLAAGEGITRGAAGIRRAASDSGGGLAGSLVVIGNAPTALFECLRLAAENGSRPAVVIGVPVGFVGAAESKQALAGSGLPHITIPGNRGGSNIAAAIANALMRLSVAGSVLNTKNGK